MQGGGFLFRMSFCVSYCDTRQIIHLDMWIELVGTQKCSYFVETTVWCSLSCCIVLHPHQQCGPGSQTVQILTDGLLTSAAGVLLFVCFAQFLLVGRDQTQGLLQVGMRSTPALPVSASFVLSSSCLSEYKVRISQADGVGQLFCICFCIFEKTVFLNPWPMFFNEVVCFCVVQLKTYIHTYENSQ